MKTVLTVAAATLVVGLLSHPGAGSAANATAPQANVDHRNDAGNDTGDSKVDTLNRGQLDSNQKAPPPAKAAPATKP